MAMFKKGQLVKYGEAKYAVIELKSILCPGEYLVKVQKVRGVNSLVYMAAEDLKHIANNFKFKEIK